MGCLVNVCFIMLEIVKSQIFVSNLMNRSQENCYRQDVWAKKIFPKYHSGTVRSILYLETTLNCLQASLLLRVRRIIFFVVAKKKCPSFVLSRIS